MLVSKLGEAPPGMLGTVVASGWGWEGVEVGLLVWDSILSAAAGRHQGCQTGGGHNRNRAAVRPGLGGEPLAVLGQSLPVIAY